MRRKPLSILFAVLALAAVATRMWLYFTAIDPATGFYTDSSRTLGLIVSVVFGVGLIACVVLFRFFSEPAPGQIVRASDLAVASFGMAGGLCYDTVVLLMQTSGTSPVKKYLIGLFALLAAAYFVCAGVDRLRGTQRTPGLLYAAVPAWAAVKLVVYYTQFHGVVYISEGVLEVFALALSMMFWLYHTRMVTGTNPGRAAQWGYGFGIAAAAACCMVTLPRLVSGLMGQDALTAHGSGLEVSLLISVIYIAVFLVRYHKTPADRPLSPNRIPDREERVARTEEPETVQTDDRINRLVDELLHQKQGENEEEGIL